MYYFIGSKTDYNDKLYLAEREFEKGHWRTAMGYYEACLQYAEQQGMPVVYLEMKVDDCKKQLGLR